MPVPQAADKTQPMPSMPIPLFIAGIVGGGAPDSLSVINGRTLYYEIVKPEQEAGWCSRCLKTFRVFQILVMISTQTMTTFNSLVYLQEVYFIFYLKNNFSI